MNYSVAQWMLIRQGKIPDNFTEYQLLTEFVASEAETIQVFFHKENNLFRLWLVWDLNGVIVRIAQAVQTVAVTSAFITGWLYNASAMTSMKRMFDELLNGQYGYGSPLIYYWTILGDRMGAGYHPIAVEEFEERQLAKALGSAESTDEIGMLDWLLIPEKGVPVKITFDGDPINIQSEEISEIPEEQYSAFSDFLQSLDIELGDDDEDTVS